MSDDDLDRLRQQTETKSRVDEAAGQQAHAELTAAIRGELDQIEAGDRQKTVSTWHGPLAALFGALDEHPEARTQLIEGLETQLQMEIDGEPKRSELVALALKVGIQEAAPETMDALRDAVREQAADQL